MVQTIGLLLKVVGAPRVIALLVLVIGVGLEIADHPVVGAELIGMSAVKLLADHQKSESETKDD